MELCQPNELLIEISLAEGQACRIRSGTLAVELLADGLVGQFARGRRCTRPSLHDILDLREVPPTRRREAHHSIQASAARFLSAKRGWLRLRAARRARMPPSADGGTRPTTNRGVSSAEFQLSLPERLASQVG